jgi:uncharacterized protein (TIGR00251 family)
MKKQIKVKPNAKRSELMTEADGSLTAHLKSPPVDGKANAELIALVAKHFGVPKSAVTIRTGGRSRHKLLEIAD